MSVTINPVSDYLPLFYLSIRNYIFASDYLSEISLPARKYLSVSVWSVTIYLSIYLVTPLLSQPGTGGNR